MGANLGPPPATIIDQKCNKLTCAQQIDAVKDRPPLTGRTDQTRTFQISQMMREGILFQIKRFRDLGRAHTLWHVPHQQTKYGQPPGMAEGGKGGNGKIRIHIS